MMLQLRDDKYTTQQLPILGGYNVQRFKQFSPEDTSNWYLLPGEETKRDLALFPTLGRKHINYAGINQLQFGSQPRTLCKTINYSYVIEGSTIYRVDANWTRLPISGSNVVTTNSPVYFAYLVVNTIVFACFVDGQKIYVYQEDIGMFYVVTDPNAPGNSMVNGVLTKPGYIAAFGNRIVVSIANSSQFYLSAINLLTNGAFDKSMCFTIAESAVFAQEEGIIRQMAVLNNTLYIFTDFTTGVWSNNAAVFSGTGAYFPWKKNSTYNWNFGIADPGSLDVDFGIMSFLAQNSDGLLQFMYSNGGQPERFSTKAIDVLLQQYTNKFGANNPFVGNYVNGFLYQYENTIFYRISGGPYKGYQILDQEQLANSIEYSFESKKWQRVTELNGERCRVQQHIYFNSKHLVTVTGDGTVYELSGDFYVNELVNPAQTNPQGENAYIAYPFRYERVTPIISNDDYAQLETEFVEIDMVFGESNINYSISPFSSVKFIVAEESTPQNPVYLITEDSDSNDPTFIIGEGGNSPTVLDNTYNTLLNPNIMLYWSDDGGISFNSADNLEFSQMGVYQWRMRWYQLGTHRNRCYKLVCVSGVPIVLLGGTMMIRRASGGAN